MANDVRALLKQGLSTKEIMDRTGLKKAAISYHRKNIGKGTPRPARDWRPLQEALDAGSTLSGVARNFSISKNTVWSAVQRGLLQYTVPDKHAGLKSALETGIGCSRGNLKRYIIANDLIPYVCAGCGVGSEWNGRPLVLQLEHKNGINNDNRLGNLEFLCPNCHSQTETFAGRNVHHAA